MDRADYEVEREVRRRFKLIRKAALASDKKKAEALAAEAVKIQEGLLIKGIKLTDSVHGTVWHRFI